MHLKQLVYSPINLIHCFLQENSRGNQVGRPANGCFLFAKTHLLYATTNQMRIRSKTKVPKSEKNSKTYRGMEEASKSLRQLFPSSVSAFGGIQF